MTAELPKDQERQLGFLFESNFACSFRCEDRDMGRYVFRIALIVSIAVAFYAGSCGSTARRAEEVPQVIQLVESPIVVTIDHY